MIVLKTRSGRRIFVIANCLFSQDQAFPLSSIPRFFQRSGPTIPLHFEAMFAWNYFQGTLEDLFPGQILVMWISILSRSQPVRFKFAFTNFLLADSFLLRRSFSSVCILSGALLRPASGLSFEQSCTTPPHHWNFEIFLPPNFVWRPGLSFDHSWVTRLPALQATKEAVKAKFILVYLSVPLKCKPLIPPKKPWLLSFYWRLQLWLKMAHRLLDYPWCKVECRFKSRRSFRILFEMVGSKKTYQDLPLGGVLYGFSLWNFHYFDVLWFQYSCLWSNCRKSHIIKLVF